MKTKRLPGAILALVTAVSMTVSPISATAMTPCAITAITQTETFGTDGIIYMIQDDAVIITGCDNNATQIVIPDTIEGLPVTQISERAFANCHNLTEITFPSTLKSIGSAFWDCTSLTEVTLPQGLEVLEGAFNCCTGLTKVTLPSTLKTIKSAFMDCTSLTEVTLPQGIEVLDNAFNVCTSLTEVTIPESVREIHNSFCNCTSLTSVHISASVTDMTEAFHRCSSLETISVDPDNAVYRSIDNALYPKDGSKLLLYPSANTNTEYTVPNTVTEIEEYAFLDAKNLTSITLPAHMTSIGSCAFQNCSSLKQITIPDGVEELDSTFTGCYSLETLTLPKSLLKIRSGAFRVTDVYYEGSVQDWSRIVSVKNDAVYKATIHFGEEDNAVHQSAVLYITSSSLSIPAEYTSYQIETTNPDATFRIIAGNIAVLSETGLITPTKRYGETIIEIKDGEQVSFLHVTTKDYNEYYADEKITAFLEESITDDMSDIEKLNVIGKLPASMDYDNDHWTYTEMIAYNTGNCAGSATMLVEMCRRLGIKAWVRNGTRDPNAGSAHVNALAEVDGVYYELEAGYNAAAPRPYNVTKRTSLCKYKDAADGIDVYQYDGINEAETALELPDTIDGKTVTRIGDGFLKENPWVKSVTIPDTVSEISESAFPDYKGILYGAKDSAAASFAAAHGIAFRVTGSLDPGDVNADLEVDILDVIAVNKYLLGASTLNESEAAAADVDADGKITSTDSLMILKYVIKLMDTFG